MIKKLLCLSLILIFINVKAQKDSLDIKIGQMILIGMPKAEVDSTVLEEVKRGRVGSVIYFEKNIPKSSSSFAALKKMSWIYQKAAPIPLFICIDQEGGKVNRLKERYGFARSITAESIGKSKSLDSVRFYSEATAATLAGLGINVNFAPCVDLAVNPTNPIIAKHGRAYSANEDSVALFAKEVVKQHRKFRIITALKHFPGHGSSQADTHLGFADVTSTWTSRELKPYQALIDSGYVDGVMSCHIVNKNLDPKGLPGTLSKPIIDGMLRKQMRYDGLVFSDDMQMRAITNNYGFEEAIKMTINAGIDILCFANNVPAAQLRSVNEIHSIIKKFVASGEIPKSRIDESFKRIIRMKKSISSENEQLKRIIQETQRMNQIHKQEVQRALDERKNIEKLLTKKQRRKLKLMK
jgi:beta-N-acetylhexosaminidase